MNPTFAPTSTKHVAGPQEMKEEPHVAEFVQTTVEISCCTGHRPLTDQPCGFDERHQHRCSEQSSADLPSRVPGEGGSAIR